MSIHVNWDDDSWEFFCCEDEGYEEEDSDSTFSEGVTTLGEILGVIDDICGGRLSLTPDYDVIDDVSGLRTLPFWEVEDGKAYHIVVRQADDSK